MNRHHRPGDAPHAMRPTEEIHNLKGRCNRLERKVLELEHHLKAIDHLRETIEQLQVISECGQTPAPIFLRWEFTTLDGCRVAEARFGKYRLDVTNGRSAVSWTIQEGKKWIDAGGGHTSFDLGMDEAEKALRRLVQSKATSSGATP